MITAFLIAVTVLIGALALYGSYMYGELKGFEQAMNEAGQIIREVHNESLNKADAGTDL